ncbi:WD repeat-containing protein 11 isoform X1 [Cucumis melo var. makuwa]|uniref:WD repeat-containing protein 11 isoform X1 n=1 Tax=Cucumis melo var. makuwa TaxID=1194695 RepID=A0A5A7U9G3_CUCMM|nr:WD repeat-containing protein 11 isoform X1 [Cucumis melo var. makuwa]TYK06394.1 WD repeat-containing protein 11 isoform X1 [Cucumis melo var. makuwa]
MKLSFYASIRLNNFLAKLSSSSVFLSTGTIGNNHLLLVSALGALSLQLSCIVQCPHAIYLFLLKKSICITLVYLTIFVVRLVSVGNLEAAVSLLLSTSPESSYFYANALRAVALSSAVSRSLLELAVKVVAANMVRTDRSLSGTHLLCAVGRYQEACSQLQDAGCWTDAATLAATHLKGSDYARVLLRWANHVFHSEHNIWRALILYVAAGALQEALAALRESQQPDTAAMFILACREIHAEFISNLEISDDESDSNALKNKLLKLPGLDPENDDVVAVGEYYGQYQRKLVHLCMDSLPYSD